MQRRIAGILSPYDDLIENCQHRIRLLDEMARALYREWFVLFRYPGHERVKPPGLATGTLGDLLVLQRGFDLPERERSQGTVPIVSSSGVTGTHDIAKADAPGIVTGRYGTLGDVYFLHEPFWPLNTTLFVKDFKGNEPYWLLYLLRSMNFSTQNAAGAVPGVNRNALHLLPARIPPRELQAHFAAIAGPKLREIDLLQRRNANLRKTRDLLLPRLLSGQLSLETP